MVGHGQKIVRVNTSLLGQYPGGIFPAVNGGKGQLGLMQGLPPNKNAGKLGKNLAGQTE